MTKVRDAIKRIEEDGRCLARQRGSHRQFKHPTKPGVVTIAGQPNNDLHPKTYGSILVQAPLEDRRVRYLIIVEGSNGGYSAYPPDLPGCVAAGGTREETLELMRQAIAFHLEGLRDDGQPIPPPTSTGEYVAV